MGECFVFPRAAGGEEPPGLARSSGSSPPAWEGGMAAAQGPLLGSRQLVGWRGESEPKPTRVLPVGGLWVRLYRQPLD